jgi:predicted N-acetyltransferase YhbS
MSTSLPAYLLAPPDGVIDAAVTAFDHDEIGQLHDRVFGPGALTRTAYRIREGLAVHSPWCRVARDRGRVIAFARFTPVWIGMTAPALMLGPVAVDPAFANLGHARRLVSLGLKAAQGDAIRAVVLVGDLAYYGRLGFSPAPAIEFPGPVDRARILAIRLDGGEASLHGVVRASGDGARSPDRGAP